MARQRFINIVAGQVVDNAARQELIIDDPHSEREGFRLRQIRVGTLFPRNGVRYTAMLTVPGGIEVGPIDIPFRFNIEGPVNIAFSTDSANTVNQVIMCTSHDLPDSPDLYGATWFLNAAIPEPPNPAYFPIWPWVVAVTIYNGDTATFYDAGGSSICTATGPQLVARPRAAEFIALSSERGANCLYHY